jgi:bifunctional aspartokinase / homoserine dehydrogenase 1
MRIMKFGGSSVGTPDRVKSVLGIVSRAQRRHRNIVVVLSAFAGVTDQLIAISRTAARGDRKYLSGVLALRRRHMEAIARLLPARRRKKIDAFVKERITDLTDVLHGVFYTKELTDRTLDYVMRPKP